MNKSYIIAEAGVNHSGDIKKAFKLIDVAKQAGADAVKFQAYRAEEMCLRSASMCQYQKNSKFNNQFDLLKKYELTKENLIELYKYSRSKKIEFMLSYFDLESLKILRNIKTKYIKIPSGEINNFLLLRHIAKKNKKIIFSTGMSNMSEIKKNLSFLINHKVKKKDITILYCVSSYPTKLEEVDLSQIQILKKKFNIDVGFSDHTKGFESAILSLTYVSKIIEKHITLNNNSIGPDHASSLNPKNFIQFVKNIRSAEMILKKNINKNLELKNKKFVTKSIVAAKKIKKGEKFTYYNLTTKRPLIGRPANKILDLIGKKSKKNYEKDYLI